MGDALKPCFTLVAVSSSCKQRSDLSLAMLSSGKLKHTLQNPQPNIVFKLVWSDQTMYLKYWQAGGRYRAEEAGRIIQKLQTFFRGDREKDISNG